MPAYAFEFGWSSSPAFARARVLAADIPGVAIAGRGRGWRARVPITPDTSAALAELVMLAASWRHSRLWWGTTPLPTSMLPTLLAVLACGQEATIAAAGLLHCWGLTTGTRRRLPCRFLADVLPRQSDGTDVGTWVTAVDGAARLRGVVACRHYQPEAVHRAIARWAAGGTGERDAQGPGPDGRLARLLEGIDLDDVP